MARENQTLQIGLIVSIIVTILMAVVTVIFFRSSQEQFRRAEAAENSQRQTDQALRKAVTKQQALEYMLAGGNTTQAELQEDLSQITTDASDESLQGIKQGFQDDMALFGEQYAENRNYQKLPDYLLTTIRDLNQQLLQRDAEVKKLTTEKDQIQNDAAARIQIAEAGLKQAQDDLEGERASFNKSLADLRKNMDAVNQTLAEQQKQHQELLASSTSNEQQLQESINNLRGQLTLLRTRNAEMEAKPSFEAADGHIISVDQRTDTVWINLGSADNLRRQMTFSVYGRDVRGVMQEEPKATIEVTQILDRHLAAASIVTQEDANIVMPSDRIHTPAWQPGRQVRFALAGFFDIDGDGQSDRDLIKSLININNGQVDAEILDNGQVQGELSPLTRYLVKGADPAEGNPEAQAAWTSMIAKAQEYGIEQMSLDELLSFMGWRGGASTVKLGTRLGSEAGQPSQPAQNEGGFQNRRPPPRGRNGAF